MHIYKLKIKNYRTFGVAGVSFFFDKGINVVIGENDSGKSVVIDAIRLSRNIFDVIG